MTTINNNYNDLFEENKSAFLFFDNILETLDFVKIFELFIMKLTY
ncbi:6864_t:CDS:2 [Cetraspora pellucida]|uniref:6864_t:CDS:1 n=1 Tax=Cetraspora pellucida TaxID=1433469 RepID=A0A9N9BIB6_9GLOM|nr:6864_t:CDS:2 [Cetraspora pellucida]